MKKQVMNLAWQLVRETGMTLSDAMRMSWKNFKLKMAMRRDIVEFRYRKVNGEVRTALGTLSEIVIPSHNNAIGTNRKQSDAVQCYYDCTKEAWRSFRKANLIGMA